MDSGKMPPMKVQLEGPSMGDVIAEFVRDAEKENVEHNSSSMFSGNPVWLDPSSPAKSRVPLIPTCFSASKSSNVQGSAKRFRLKKRKTFHLCNIVDQPGADESRLPFSHFTVEEEEEGYNTEVFNLPMDLSDVLGKLQIFFLDDGVPETTLKPNLDSLQHTYSDIVCSKFLYHPQIIAFQKAVSELKEHNENTRIKFLDLEAKISITNPPTFEEIKFAKGTQLEYLNKVFSDKKNYCKTKAKVSIKEWKINHMKNIIHDQNHSLSTLKEKLNESSQLNKKLKDLNDDLQTLNDTVDQSILFNKKLVEEKRKANKTKIEDDAHSCVTIQKSSRIAKLRKSIEGKRKMLNDIHLLIQSEEKSKELFEKKTREIQEKRQRFFNTIQSLSQYINLPFNDPKDIVQASSDSMIKSLFKEKIDESNQKRQVLRSLQSWTFSNISSSHDGFSIECDYNGCLSLNFEVGSNYCSRWHLRIKEDKIERMYANMKSNSLFSFLLSSQEHDQTFYSSSELKSFFQRFDTQAKLVFRILDDAKFCFTMFDQFKFIEFKMITERIMACLTFIDTQREAKAIISMELNSYLNDETMTKKDPFPFSIHVRFQGKPTFFTKDKIQTALSSVDFSISPILQTCQAMRSII